MVGRPISDYAPVAVNKGGRGVKAVGRRMVQQAARCRREGGVTEAEGNDACLRAAALQG